MKSVLISIRPEWVKKILSGEKTIEVRKNAPKIATPFKCYIYCTKERRKTDFITKSEVFGYINAPEHIFCNRAKEYDANGKVIGEFVCDKIYDITPHFDTPTFPNQYICGWEYGKEFDCLSFEELTSYLNGKQGFGWHISDLVIYDKPRELSEFYHYCGDNPNCDGCEAHYFSNTECGKEDYCCSPIEGCKPLKRPPQSWCYVESEDT